MTYNHNSQFRAIIVRSKSLTDLDNLLIVYAEIISEITPCHISDFSSKFNTYLKSRILHSSTSTLDNHRTEIAGKLFGMFYKEGDIILISERAKLLIETGDQPAFFKDLCAKFQFPSAMNKPQTIISMINQKINVRQFAFFLKVLTLLQNHNIKIDRKQAGYYIFNSLDVLKREASPDEVVNQIKSDVESGIYRKIKTPGKATSFDMQHINEQIVLLILANVIFLNDNEINLNPHETAYIESLSEMALVAPEFDFYSTNMHDVKKRKFICTSWDYYFSNTSKIEKEIIQTKTNALSRSDFTTGLKTISTKDLGDEGEDFVYQYELERVSKVSDRLKNKVLKFGATRGIGFDIQSVWANQEKPDSPIFIEVKSTKRVTSPTTFSDSINLTRNEWVAAETHGENYFIYRVYFTSTGNKIFVIENPYKLYKDDDLFVLPLTYRVDFKDDNGVFLDE